MSTVPRGTEGAVSLEGTLAGLLASVILSGVACALNLVQDFGTHPLHIVTLIVSSNKVS